MKISEKQQQQGVIQTLAIKDILRDKKYQVRNKLDNGRRNMFMSVFKELDLKKQTPEQLLVTVFKQGLAYILVDGWHRIAALELLGRGTVEAIVIEGTEEALYDAIFNASKPSSLPLKSTEHVNRFRMYMKAGKNINKWGRLKSYRDIAKDLDGVKGHTTIRNWMEKYFIITFRSMEKSNPDTYQDFKGKQHGSHNIFERDAMSYYHEDLRNKIWAIEDTEERSKVAKAIMEDLQQIVAQGDDRRLLTDDTFDGFEDDADLIGAEF